MRLSIIIFARIFTLIYVKELISSLSLLEILIKDFINKKLLK